MAFLCKFRTPVFRPDIELGPQARARGAAFQYHDSYEEVPLDLPADKGEKAQHHDLLKHKDAFGRSPDLRSVTIRNMITTAGG
jgi:hypothetical protein